jgi:hypothetical protein
MWGYRQDGIIVAVNPNDMSGNSGWEEVPDGTVPVEPEEEPQTPNKSADERLDTLEPTVDEVVDVLGKILGV